ncbi:hypothetical protein BN961_00218 [Afipia felis]|uniref:Uncharacterized protein n=1 Tax=Afipia felis TaxID=1035 RepID=A0A090MKL3_AFIFE|nr:hypothetical protein BN961_00218 [Afipia felis]
MIAISRNPSCQISDALAWAYSSELRARAASRAFSARVTALLIWLTENGLQ